MTDKVLDEVRQLEREVEEAERVKVGAENRIKYLQRQCVHDWGEVMYDQVVREAFTSPGDPPGTMGIDWRGPTYHPREERRRWKRVCRKCGLMEYTERTQEKVEHTPLF